MAEPKPTGAFAPTSRQWALAAGGALVLALLAFALWYLLLGTSMAPAFTKLREADAALIVGELKRQKTPYRLADDGRTILVPADQVDAARIAILGGDLPLKGTVGFELFNKSDMGLTEFAQKINYQRALQGELARTLMSMATVESARIHLTLPEDGIFREDRRPAKASVTVTAKAGATIDPRSVVGIQRLIASAVEGLDAANVVVLDGSGAQLSADNFSQAAEPLAEESGTPAERAFARRIRAAALQLVSDPAMRVTVWAPAADASIRKQRTPEGNRRGEEDDRREFLLRITIALTAPPGPELRGALVPLLESTVGYDPTLGDSLTLITLPASSPYRVDPPVAPAKRSAPAAITPAAPDHGSFMPALMAATLAAAIGAAVFLRRLRGRPMTKERRESFAAQLRDMLEQDERLHNGQA